MGRLSKGGSAVARVASAVLDVNVAGFRGEIARSSWIRSRRSIARYGPRSKTFYARTVTSQATADLFLDKLMFTRRSNASDRSVNVGAAEGRKSSSHFNDKRVRSFVLTGAPKNRPFRYRLANTDQIRQKRAESRPLDFGAGAAIITLVSELVSCPSLSLFQIAGRRPHPSQS